MFDLINRFTGKISDTIFNNRPMNHLQFIEKELLKWKFSQERLLQIKGFLYYNGHHDILDRKRTVIGENGKLQEIDNLPNNLIVDNQYKKLVNQKANYLLGKPLTFVGDNTLYIDLLKNIFNKRFFKSLKSAGKLMLNGGIAWLYPFCAPDGSLSFKLFPSYEILPFWFDSEHTSLDLAVRYYQVSAYNGMSPVTLDKVEIYSPDGVEYYQLENGRLIPDPDSNNQNYLVFTDCNNFSHHFNWNKIPLIPLKYNDGEIPLLKNVKSLQDGINIMLSDFENNMQEDARNTILVLKNYDGQSLSEFRKNLAAFGAVKVRCDGDAKGGVDTLEINVNPENYKTIISIFKKALIENGMGYDAKDDRLWGNPNQMNIQSMYSDIDLDANDMETELQAAFEDILWFVNTFLSFSGYGDFFDERVTVIFNRDVLINESEAIDNCRKSIGMLSDESIISQHPWVDDPQLEMRRQRCMSLGGS